MNNEEIIWYVFQLISVILGSFIAHMVLKYIKKKPLGMQTMFDEIIKDTIYLNMLDMVLSVIVLVAVKYPTPLNPYVIRTIVICRHSMSIAMMCQFCILMLIRYLYIFYPTQMNNAPFAKNLARLLLVYISFTSSLYVDVKKTKLFILYYDENDNYKNGSSQHLELSGTFNSTLSKTEKNSFHFHFSILAIGVSICLVILIFTQYKIEKFNQFVDAQQQQQQPQQPQQVQHQQEREENQNQNVSEDNSKNTYRIVLAILIVVLISMTLFMLITPPEHMHIKMLK